MNSQVRHAVEEAPDQLATRLMQKAHNRDGLPEVLCGAVFLFAAAYTSMIAMPRSALMNHRGLFLADILLLAALCVAGPWLLRGVRGHFLIGRVGYVRTKPNWRKLVIIAIAGLITFLLLLLGAFFMRIPHLDDCVIASLGLFIGWVSPFWGRSLRFLVFGALAIPLGLVLVFSPLDINARLAIFFGSMGALWLLSGCVVLIRFLRQPVEAGE